MVAVLCLAMFSGCRPAAPSVVSPDESPMKSPPTDFPDLVPSVAPEPVAPNANEPNKIINIWSFTNEIPNMVEKYKELNPDFPYDFNITIIATTNGAYQTALDQALLGEGGQAPDLFGVDAAFVLKYTQGDASSYTLPYTELGIDINAEIAAAEIATYAFEVGTRPTDGAVVGLPYQATGGAFIYRRSIAINTWGTDDPTVVATKIGPGWEQFMEAAEELKQAGYVIVSGDGDLWHPIESNTEYGWIKDGNLNLEHGVEAFLDLSKQLKDNGYSNDTSDWTDPWYADMAGIGPKPCFGFFGPARLINSVMSDNSGDTYGDWCLCEPPNGFFWGGTWVIANRNYNTEVAYGVAELIKWITLDTSESGLQYLWANGILDDPDNPGTKDTVSSGVVMAKSDGTLDYLGGQDMFDIFIPACANASGANKSQYDESINLIWRDQVRAYTTGDITRQAAIDDFKQLVNDTLGIPSQ